MYSIICLEKMVISLRATLLVCSWDKLTFIEMVWVKVRLPSFFFCKLWQKILWKCYVSFVGEFQLEPRLRPIFTSASKLYVFSLIFSEIFDFWLIYKIIIIWDNETTGTHQNHQQGIIKEKQTTHFALCGEIVVLYLLSWEL